MSRKMQYMLMGAAGMVLLIRLGYQGTLGDQGQIYATALTAGAVVDGLPI